MPDSRFLRTLFTLILSSIVLVTLTGPVQADFNDPGGNFIDDDGAYYEGSVEAIVAAGIEVGCTDRAQFCPDREVTREEMAAVFSRALGLPIVEEDYFIDDSNSIFEGAINRIAAVGITRGCNPPFNDRFCPKRTVSREEFASFLVRAFSIPETAILDRFSDDDGSVHEDDIDRLAGAGVTVGCNPPANDRYCPQDNVARGQMAVFLTRAIPLQTIEPPPRPPTHLVSRFTTYHSCCQSRVTNIQLMAREIDEWIVLPWEEFDLNEVLGPRTESKGYVAAPILLRGESYCCDHPLNIGGGTSQFATTIYNAVFWGAYDDISHKPHSRYISRYPLGIEATLGHPSPNVVFVNDTWTPVIIRTSYSSTSITVEFWGNNGGHSVLGSHRNSKTTINVTSGGDSTARKVTAQVTGSATFNSGGFVTIKRTISGPDGSVTETWNHTYIGSSG